VWNLAAEQGSWWRPGRKGAPGYLEQCRQLTQARADHPWLRAGSQMVQQQALRDFSQAMAGFFGGTHRRPAWRKAGRDEGFRIVAVRAGQVRRLSRKTGAVWIPKACWVRFRWSRAVPQGVKSYRVTLDRAGRWHLAFAAIPAPIPAPGTGEVAGLDRGVAVSAAFDLIRVEDLNIGNMTRSARGTITGPGRNVRAKAGLNRGILASAWGLLVRRLEEKAPGRVEKINPVFTSQRCSVCGHIAAGSRKSQALFRCVACGYAGNADLNAAHNIAAGHAVTARGGVRGAGPVNREPQPPAS
jgi:putative transposase